MPVAWLVAALLAQPAAAEPLCTGYEQGHAVVIGINTYQGRVPRLLSARQDAERMAQALKGRGFEVQVLLDDDATRDEILETLGQTLLDDDLGPCDRVVVFFAGHGETVGGDKPLGYLIPVDGDPKRPHATGISMTAVTEFLTRSPARHRMFLADACYSGLALPNSRRLVRPDTGSGRDRMVRRALAEPVTVVAVAGERDQVAFADGEGGLFTRAVLAAIRGEADDDHNGLLSDDELVYHVRRWVEAEARRRGLPAQSPVGARLGGGRFLLRTDGALPTPVDEDPMGLNSSFRGRGRGLGLWPWIWTAAGVSVATLAVGVGLNASLDAARDDYDRADTWPEARDALSTGDTALTWRNVSYVASGVAAATAAGLLIAELVGTDGPAATAWIGPGLAGVGFTF